MNKPKGCDPCSYPKCGCAYSENDPRRADAMSDDKPMVFLGTPDDKALIARLRAWYTPGETITGDVALYLEAADAVERLREEVSRLTAALSVTWSIAEG